MNFKALLTTSLKSRKFQYALAFIAFVAVLPLFVRSEYLIGNVLTVMIIFALYASSWNLLAYSGQGSLGHAAFLGIGGFTSALVAIRLGIPPIVGLFIGGLLSAGIGLLVGLACVRLKAWFLAMVTFGFSVIAVTIVSQFDSVFGGMIGFATPTIVPQGVPFFYATLAIVTVSIGAIFLVMRSKWGLAFKAIRENELEAKMIGINTAKYRLLAFIISTFFAGLAGGLYAESALFIQISIFEPYYSFLPLIMAVIGGLGTLEGPIIGSIIIVAIDSFAHLSYDFLQPLSPLFPGVNNIGPPLKFVGLGLFLIVVVIFLPKGITSLLHRLYDYLREGETKKVKEK
ncbi:MAG: branched-chain amino acid ABC transporter permease [Candidatus Bathyarchaeota archaeon]|nr:branched-chain amino acid ABC transporter permease [Candidatus Bathyarchaeota archaeon]